MIQAIKKLLLTSRPISWPNTAYPFAAAYLVSGGQVDAAFVVGTLYFLIPYNLLMYGVNDVFDYESDIKNPRKGGLEGAVEQKAFHPTILWAAVIVNVPFIIFLLLNGTMLSNLVFACLIFFVVAYSVAGLRFKEVPVLDSVTSSIHFVGPLVFALCLTQFSATQLPYVVAFFLWGIASHAFGAVQDIIPDRKANISSIATYFGARKTVQVAFMLYIISCVALLAQGGLSIIVGIAASLYALNISPCLDVTDNTSGATNSAWKRFIWLNLCTGFVITMLLMYQLIF